MQITCLQTVEPFLSEVCVVKMNKVKQGRNVLEHVSLWLISDLLRGRRVVGCRWVTAGWTSEPSDVAKREDGGWGMDTVGSRGSEGAGRPPDGSLMLGGLQQASVVRHDLVFWQLQVELQRHQHRELEGYQLSAVHSEPLFQFLPEKKRVK